MIVEIDDMWSIYQDGDRVYAKNKKTKAVYAIGTAGKKLNKQELISTLERILNFRA